MAKPWLNIGFGTGNPAGAPDFKPMNPWGRPMPKPERQPRPELHQVHVKDAKTARIIPVGPKTERENAEMLCIAIGQQIALGAERQWREPHVVRLI
jgi:hypothetical protein